MSIVFLLGGCQSLMMQSPATPPPVVNALPIPLASHEFSIDAFRDDVVGEIQVITAEYEDTLSDIARR
ncbi:MAG: hypothetical protein KDK05_26405, partial [Candidatus Competibacteraceae bacterium]|nr:hypothetical protein [Candidatus Competibacteraceae bacterium]